MDLIWLQLNAQFSSFQSQHTTFCNENGSFSFSLEFYWKNNLVFNISKIIFFKYVCTY